MKFLSLWGPAIAMSLAIFYVSSLSSPPGVSGWKSSSFGHLTAYALLGTLILRAVARGTWAGVTGTAAWAAWALTVAYGVSDEWHQSFVPGREASTADVIVDAIGAAMAVLIVLAIGRASARRARLSGGRAV